MISKHVDYNYAGPYKAFWAERCEVKKKKVLTSKQHAMWLDGKAIKQVNEIDNKLDL